MRWIPIAERLPQGADAISCEAWCEAEEPGEVAGPCIMGFDADAEPEDQWTPREDTGCWEPGPVTHWRARPAAPGVPAVQLYRCVKCGYTGPDQIHHQRPNGTGECGYIAARVTDGVPASSTSDREPS